MLLSLAAENGHEVVVKMLFDTGKVDATAEDIYGLIALQLSVFNSYEDVERLLLAYNAPIVSDFYGLQSLFHNII